MKQQIQNGIRWTTKCIYIDIQTGEIITKHQYKIGNYITTQKTKNAKINSIQTEGIITYTYECKRNPQLQLELN